MLNMWFTENCDWIQIHPYRHTEAQENSEEYVVLTYAQEAKIPLIIFEFRDLRVVFKALCKISNFRYH
jgi:hypothetical protein